MPLALFALTLSAFAIGTTEFVVVGLIPTISNDLNISLPSAGLLISLYALGVAVSAPLLTAITGKWNRKTLLLTMMTLFTFGNILAYFSPTYELLTIARVLTGVAHGVFFSIGATIATSLVSKDKEASAIAIMFTGLTVALVTGVPLGTYVGQELGWRATFLIVAALGMISVIGSLILIPKNVKKAVPIKIADQLSVIKNPRLLLAYFITILGFGGPFIAFTFLVPILEDVTKVDSGLISIILLVYGVAVLFGNIGGGKLADKIGPVQALIRVFIGLILTLITFYFAATNMYFMIATIFILGFFTFGNVPIYQVYVVQLAQKYEPNAVDVASGLNIAAFNIGIATASWVGGLIVTNLSLMATAWIGVLVLVCALSLTYFSYRLEKNT